MQPLLSLGEYQRRYEEELARSTAESYVARIWAKDTTVWKSGPEHGRIIANSLGWLTVAGDMIHDLAQIRQFTGSALSEGFTQACLLGMGGSSLCPEVCALTYGSAAGYLSLDVLDTTDPAMILSTQRKLDLARTLFLVSSKSGGTIESSSLHRYFYEQVRRLKANEAGRSFVAITDPGTSLERLGHEQRFRHVFPNPPDIGGRYSALSFFGLVPMALIGMDLDAVLRRAQEVARQCRLEGQENPGLALGIALGVLARHGRDKVTFVLAPEIAAFAPWVEQLLAESTGKDGVGILPIEGEALGEPGLYQDDRVFVQVTLEGSSDPAVDAKLSALGNAGHPVLSWKLRDTLDLAGEFFLWEFATAVAGAVMRIDPFDQPNVQESKDNTRRLIQLFKDTGELKEPSPAVTEGPLSFYYAGPAPGRAPNAFSKAVAAFLDQAGPHDYVAVMAYIERSKGNDAALQGIREAIRHRTGRATTIGYGPRFLHSTGQLHKGGGNNGLFVQITADDREDIPIPGEEYSFGVLKRAQSSGDLEALRQHERRAIRIHIRGELAQGLDRICRTLS